MRKLFHSRAVFSKTVERVVRENRGTLTYIDAVVCCAEDQNMEIETVVKLLSKDLKEKIHEEADSLHLLARELSISA